jgi:hypothetical protein
MLQTIEAEIMPNGNVLFLEPLNLAHKVKAYVTILSDRVTGTAENHTPNSGKELLNLLGSEEFANAPKTNSNQLDQTILANLNAWND